MIGGAPVEFFPAHDTTSESCASVKRGVRGLAKALVVWLRSGLNWPQERKRAPMSDLKLPLDLFRNVVARHGSAPALAFEGRQTSYAELDRRSNQCANALIAAGIKPGERVC